MFTKRKEATITTARDMKKYVFEKGVIPTPIYTHGNQSSQIVQPRGTIFIDKKRSKPLDI